ncbi:MAG: DUF2231 domain-containing protein [Anaerolineales bacterium]
MKSFLQGRWLGHPFHSVLVHLPTALFPAALLFDLLSHWGDGNNVFVQVSFYAIALGLLPVLPAVATGLADWWDIGHEQPARKLGLAHMLLNITAAILWVLNLSLRLNTYQTAVNVPVLPLTLSIIATLMLMVAGYLGGRMVYEHGVSVIRQPQSKTKWRRLAELGGADVPPQSGDAS